MAPKIEKHAFQAEVNQVLSLVVNSLYTHKEVFLRELVSNASDALDQLSFRALTDADLLGDDKDFGIELIPDEDANTLTIRDNGAGMSHDELVQNLGTIAHSGTRKLVEALQDDEKDSVSLIGQFGVGFYSAFLVTDHVAVVSRAAGSDEAWRWESEAHGEFTVAPAEKDGRGTDVILHLREDESDYLREWTLRELVRKYSDFVRHPIRLEVTRQEPVGDEKDEHGAPKNTETVRTLEQINSGSALWARPKADITDEQYAEFYKHLTHDWEAPLVRSHFKVEGTQEFTGLMFVPARAPMDLFGKRRTGIRLYVKRVFIMEDCEELLPDWLRFVRGVVDSDDLPLNVSREVLQKDRATAAIRKQVIKRALTMLEDLAEREEQARAAAAEESTEEEAGDGEAAAGDADVYERFWSQFGRVLKEGISLDPQYRDRIAKLLRFETSRDESLTSFQGYVERFRDGQEAIYYVTAASRAAAASSPQIEGLRSRGYEVLFLTDPVDEWLVDTLTEFEGHKLVSAAKGAFDLPDEDADDEDEEKEDRAASFAPLTERMQTVLEDTVEAVRLSDRLTDSPACLVTAEDGMSPHLERLLRANRQAVPDVKRTLEINPAHPVVERLRTMAASEENEERVQEWTRLLYDQALVAEGSAPSDPARFARQITKLMTELGA